jgi:hypothetical protein
MGLREDAEKINAERDARAAEAEARQLALAREKVPESLSVWSTGMGLDVVPGYTVTGANCTTDYDDDGPSAHVELSFEVDGIGFSADLKLYLGRTAFKVGIEGGYGRDIRTVEDVAAVLRVLDLPRS